MNTNNKIFNTDSRYKILFEPVKIGPVISKNRFYQVPHCNGGGYRDPSAVAEMRKIKSSTYMQLYIKQYGSVFCLQCKAKKSI